MQQNSTSAMQAGPVESTSLLTVKKDSVTCPTCGRFCYFSALDNPDDDAFSRCLSVLGGCGTNFSFNPSTAVLTSRRVAPEPLSADGTSQRPSFNVDGIVDRYGPPEGSKEPESKEPNRSKNETVLEPISSSNSAARKVPPKLDNGAQSVGIAGNPITVRSYDAEISDSEVASRVQNFDRRKRIGECISKRLIERGSVDLGRQVSDCSSEVTIRRYQAAESVEVQYANWCQKRILCPNCEKARASRTIGKWVPKVVEALTVNDCSPYMVTLTLKNGRDLSERIDHIFKSLQKANCQRRDYLSGRLQRRSAFGTMQGALWHLEIKRGKGSGEWHPHLHGLVLLPKGETIDAEQLSGEWKAYTRDSFITDIRPTNFATYMLLGNMSAEQAFQQEAGREFLLRDLCEILKYCLKFDGGQSPDDIIDAYQICYGRRLSRSWGNLRSLKTVDKLSNTSESDAIGPYLDYVLKWCREQDAYQVLAEKAGCKSSEASDPSEQGD